MTKEAPPAAAPVVDRMAAARAARKAKQDAKAPVAEPKAPPAAAPVVGFEAPSTEERITQPVEATDPDAPPEKTILQKVAANAEHARQAKIEAMRKAKAGHNTDVGEPMVMVRVLKHGHGLISMGDHIGGLGDLTYDHGETPSFPQSIAQALEDKGLVEIQ